MNFPSTVANGLSMFFLSFFFFEKKELLRAITHTHERSLTSISTYSFITNDCIIVYKIGKMK
jgi:hypothetical protein